MIDRFSQLPEEAVKIAKQEGASGLAVSLSGQIGWWCAGSERIRHRYSKKCFDITDPQFKPHNLFRYGESETVQFSPSSTDIENVRTIDSPSQNYTIAQPYVYTVDNVSILGPLGITTTSDGAFIFENSIERIKPFTKGAIQSRIIKRFDSWRDVNAAVSSFVGPLTDNYFHWFSDYLPRVRGVQEYERKHDKAPVLLLPQDPPEWLIDSLLLLDYDEDRFMFWDEGKWNVEKLVVPSVPRSPWDGYDASPVYSRRARTWVRDQLTDDIQTDENVSSRVYISRADAPNRRMQNKNEVMSVLDEFNIETVELSGMTLRDQISMFQGVDCIVAPHGAGLTNMLWGTDQQIVEIFGADVLHGMDRKACYYRMADQLNHEYVSIRGSPCGEDITLPPEQLADVLAKVVGDE